MTGSAPTRAEQALRLRPRESGEAVAGQPPGRVAAGRFRTDIQGLRALAVLAVVLYHAHLPGVPGGYVGVDVFFVISGFLITGLLWRELTDTGRVSLAAFYARRVRRLLPAAVLVLTVTLAASRWLLAPLQVSDVARDAAAAALYAANYRFALLGTDYLAAQGPPSPIQHFWSLGVEEQFYLVWPVLLLALTALHRGRASRAAATAALAVLGAASLVGGVVLTTVSQPWAFYSLPTRAWELAAGGLLALSLPALRRMPSGRSAALGWLGVAAAGWAVVRFDADTAFPGVAAVLPVAGTAAVIAAGCSSPRLGPDLLLRRAPFQVLGRISYSLYLWHWPVLILGARWGTGPLVRLGLVLLSAALAGVTVVLLEDPFRRARSLARVPRRGLAVGAGLTAGAVAAAVATAFSVPGLVGTASPAALPALGPQPADGKAAQPGTPSATQPPASPLETASRTVLEAVARGAAVQSVPANLTPSLAQAHGDKAAPFVDGCNVSYTARTSPPCGYGDPAGSTRIVALGDSHAAQWFPALDGAAKQQHWRFENLTKVTCPPMPIPLVSPVLGRDFRECGAWRDAALQRIRAERPALVVVGVARHYSSALYHFQVYSDQWNAALHSLVADLRAAGSSVLVLGPNPKPAADVPTCLSVHLDDVPSCTGPLDAEVDLSGVAAERAAVTSAGGSYLDVYPWVCTPARCADVVGNVLVFRDDNHFSTSFASWLTPVISLALQQAMSGDRAAAGGAGPFHPAAR